MNFTHKEYTAGAAHMAAAIAADTNGVRTALRDAARAACTTMGIPNAPPERLDQIALLALSVAVGPLPQGPG